MNSKYIPYHIYTSAKFDYLGNSGQPFKFGGKELVTANGLNEYDFGARRYYQAIPHFTSIDKYSDMYYHISPYVYCGNNPTNRIDVNGDSIAVLNVGGIIGHSAMLIQDSSNKWHYYSKNGDYIYKFTKGMVGGKGYHDTGERSFDSPEQFLNSNYNREGTSDEVDKNEVSNYEFSEAIILPTSRDEDNKAKNTFIEKSNEFYSVLLNNCAHVVYSALKSTGINVATKHSVSDSQGMTANLYTSPLLPRTLFNNLINLYPNAKHIKK